MPLALCEAACGVTIAGEVAGVVDGAVTTGCGAGVGSLPSSTPGANVVGAPRKPLLVTGAPVGSSLFSVELLTGRMSPCGTGTELVPAPPLKSGGAGRA